MTAGIKEFEFRVGSNWSAAVCWALAEYPRSRADLVRCLSSDDPEVRSAAVAALNEADDASAHDEVLALIEDSNHEVQCEDLEYLKDMGRPSDAAQIFAFLERGQHLFVASLALRSVIDDCGPTVDEEESAIEQAHFIRQWRGFLESRGLLAQQIGQVGLPGSSSR